MSNDDVGALRATAHPLRLQMLSLLTAASMSAAELARELGTSQANASYHLRVLADAGEVVPDGEEVVRGGVAKKYRHPWNRPKRPGTGRGQILQAFAHELARRFAGRAPGSATFLCDAEMWVTDEVWTQVLEHVTAASTLMHDQARRPHTEGTAHRNLQMVAFEMTDRP